MKNKIIYIFVITLLFSFTNNNVTSKNYLEKIYVQTDRPLYFPSETVWYKAYITNAKNKTTTISNMLKVQLISPKGIIIKTQDLNIKQGAAFSNFNIDKNWVGGIYKLRFFTNWMRNFGSISFFEKEIIVQKIVKPNLLMKLKFPKKSYGEGSNVIANFEVKNLKNKPLNNQQLRYTIQYKAKTIISKSFQTDNDGKKILFLIYQKL